MRRPSLDHGRQVSLAACAVGQAQTVAHRHRAETLAAAAIAGFHVNGDVQHHSVGHHPAAELDRRPVLDVLGVGCYVEHSDVSWLSHAENVGLTSPNGSAPGELIGRLLVGGCHREWDTRAFYPILDGIPVLLADEAIPLVQIR